MTSISALSKQELQILSKQSGMLLSRYYPKTRVMERLYDNPEMRFGVPQIEEDVPQSCIGSGHVSPDTQQDYLRFFDMIAASIPSGFADVKLRTHSGEYRWHRAHYSLVYGEDQLPFYALINFSDNTETRENELAAEKWSASLSSLLSETFLYAEVNLTRNAVELLSTGLSPKEDGVQPTTLADVAELGLDGAISDEARADYQEFFSRQRLLGLFAENVREDKMDFCVTPFPEQGADAEATGGAGGGGAGDAGTVNGTAKGAAPRQRVKWSQAGVRMIKSPHSGDIMAGISFTPMETPSPRRADLASLANWEGLANHEGLTNIGGLANWDGLDMDDLADLTHKAYHDHLTGLLNREGFTSRVTEALSRHDLAQTTALFMIDLDNFKQINDRLGHQVGDTVLCRVGDALRATFRSGDVLGRLGGDEFIVLLQGPLTQRQLEQKALELLSAVRVQDAGLTLPVSVSIGVVFGRSKQPFERLYRMADIALYTSKKAGKNRFHITNSDTNEEQTYSSSEGATALVSLQDLLQDPEIGQKKKSRTPYEALLENIPGGVVTLEMGYKTFKVTRSNDWLYQFLDYPKEKLAPELARNPFCMGHPDDMHAVKSALRQVLKGKDEFNVVFRVRTRAGEYKHTSLRASITERRDDLVIMHGIHTDVDKMVTMQQELERSRKQLEHMVNSIPGGIALMEFTDRLRTYVYGDWLSTHCGFSPEELKGIEECDEDKHVFEDDKPLMRAFYERFKQGEDSASVTVRLRTKFEALIPVHIKGSVIERTPQKISVYALLLAG